MIIQGLITYLLSLESTTKYSTTSGQYRAVHTRSPPAHSSSHDGHSLPYCHTAVSLPPTLPSETLLETSLHQTHTTVRSALLITTTAESNLLERRAKRCGIRRPPLRTLETTYAERCFPLALVSHTARISHTARLLLRPPRKLRGGHPPKCSLERTQCVLVEFRTSLERGEQDLQILLSFGTESFP